jgi:hypothetical protein
MTTHFQRDLRLTKVGVIPSIHRTPRYSASFKHRVKFLWIWILWHQTLFIQYTASLQIMKLLVFQLSCNPFPINFMITTSIVTWAGTITYFRCYNMNCMLSFKHTLGTQKKTGRSSSIFLLVYKSNKTAYYEDYICIVSVLQTS